MELKLDPVNVPVVVEDAPHPVVQIIHVRTLVESRSFDVLPEAPRQDELEFVV